MTKHKIPDMKDVASSNIESVGYDHASKELHVRFKNGSHYAYSDVPASLHDDLHEADSIGKFMRANVNGKFRHRKLDI